MKSATLAKFESNEQILCKHLEYSDSDIDISTNKKKRILVCLGGNALGNTVEEQRAAVKFAAHTIASLAKKNYEIVVSHGNGPQVGMINLSFEYSSKNLENISPVPFPECGAMSQGYIGYHLQQAITNEFFLQGIEKSCATIVTQTVVSENDSAFQNPTKPVGSFYSKEQAEKIALEKGYTFTEDSGRGYRRVVASPEPLEIIESSLIKKIIQSDNIVIAVGGGGIPVIKTKSGLHGIDAVIDKDLSNAKLASELNVDVLLILTAIEKVALNFNKPNEKFVSSLSVEDCKKYIAEGHFAKGSMLPKIQACINFLQNSKSDAIAIITALEKAEDALAGKTGTLITR